MKCANCPLFSWWNNESDKGESCGLFGDSWDSVFQYEDKDGNIVGCYIDRHYIEQTGERYMKHLEECVERFKAEEAKGEYDWLKEKDVVERKRGKWVQVMGKYDWMVKCSRCNGVPIETSNYCPNCGADMRESEGEE